MAKIRRLIIIGLAIISVVAGFSACKPSRTESECLHEWSEYVVTEKADCVNQGEEQSMCVKCGEKHTNVLPALGHEEERVPAIAPTCLEGGLTEGKRCSRCGEETEKGSFVPALGHEYSEFIIKEEATCTKTGLKYRKCNRCGEKGETAVIEKTAHEYGTYYSNDDATCLKDGTKSARCVRCGNTDTVTDEGTALAHDVVIDVGFEAACDRDGLSEGSHCRRCGTVLTEATVLPALGHEEEEIPAVAPSCTQNGKTSGVKCARCKKILSEQSVLPSLGHEIEEIPAVQPDCVNSGKTKGEKCSRCGEVLAPQNEVPALGHKYKETKVEFTCTTDGYVLHACSRCGDNYKTDEIAAHHVWNMENATCGADKKCVNCDVVGEKASGNHSFTNGICTVCRYACEHDYETEEKAATCEEKAQIIKTCKLCDVVVKTETGAKLGHDGNVVCSRCNTRVLPEDFFVRTFKTALGKSYAAQITGLKLTSDLDSPTLDVAFTRYENGNEYIELNITAPSSDYTQTATAKIRSSNGKIYVAYDGKTVTERASTERGESTTVKTERYEAVSDVNAALEYALIPSALRPLIKKVMLFGSEQLQTLLSLANKYPDKAEKIGEYVFGSVYFCRADSGYSLVKDRKSAAFAQKLTENTLSALYDEIFGEGELAKTKARLALSEDAADVKYLAYLNKYSNKKIAEIVSDRLDGSVTPDEALDLVCSWLGAENGSSSLTVGESGSVRFNMSGIWKSGGAFSLTDAVEKEKEWTVLSAADEIKSGELTDEKQKQLYREHTLVYDAENDCFTLGSTFNLASRIVYDADAGKSFMISVEKVICAATTDALPAMEIRKKDCVGYEAHSFAFEFTGTESVRAVKYELKNGQRGYEVAISEEEQSEIFALLADYAQYAAYVKPITLKKEIRLMKNLQTGEFALIPEGAKVSSVTRHDYVLSEAESVSGSGCGAAAKRAYVCSVCGDSYEVYEKIAHGDDYTTSFVFDGNDDCSEGVTVIYSCADCGSEVKRYKTYNHVQFAEYVSLGENACDSHAVQTLSCPCGKQKTIVLVEKVGKNYVQCEYSLIKTERTQSNVTMIYAYECAKCGVLAIKKVTLGGENFSVRKETLTVGKGSVTVDGYVFIKNNFTVALKN